MDSGSNLKIISMSTLVALLLTFNGCGSSSGCCPNLKKEQESNQNLETLATQTVSEPASEPVSEPTSSVVEEEKKVENPAPTPPVTINKPPISVINGITSQNAVLGSTILVDGFNSMDDNKISTYRWTLNNKVISTLEEVEIPLEQPGTYNICLEVTDDQNAKHKTCETVVVPIPNETPIVNNAPVAVISGITSPQAKVGDILSVNGSLSSDDINITSYQWSLNGLVISDQEQTNITLEQPGVYNICLDVYDGSNATNQTCKKVLVPKPVVILSNPPVAVITGVIDNEQKAPGQITVSGINSSDDVGIVSYQWSVDGVNTSTGQNSVVDLNIPSSKICLTVKDEDNQTNQTCKNVTVVAPSLPKAVMSGLDGVVVKTQCPIIVSANGSSSNNSVISGYQWLLDDAPIATTQDINISVATEGTHKLCLNVTDSTGAVSEDNCQNIVVNPHVAPTPKLTLIDDLTSLPVTNKTLQPSHSYSLSCAGSMDDCNHEVESCNWNASSYLVAADGTRTPYIANCFDDAQHTGHGAAITTTLTPSYIKLCGNTARFNVVEVTLSVTDKFGNTKKIIEEYSVTP